LFCKNLLSQYYKEVTNFEFNVKRTQKRIVMLLLLNMIKVI